LGLLDIIIIAFGLAMDCFAVSITIGVNNNHIHIRKGIKISLLFGIFQAIMPVFGWLLGLSVKSYIENIDHWIAFGIFFLLGIKMIIESQKIAAEKKPLNTEKYGILLLLALATSIDALIAGTGFIFLEISIIQSLFIVGIVTFCLSMAGLYAGKKYGRFCGKKAELIGGIIMLAIGTKILTEHLYIHQH